MSTPSSIINICSGVRLNNKYEHTIWFDNVTSQLNYFAGKVVKTFSAYSYLRKSWSIKVEATLENAMLWSYLYFNNGGKTYYYFINNVEYVNENMVELHIEMDVMQTYLFNHTLLHSFVEREHASSDIIGENVVEEGLELGELVNRNSSSLLFNDLCVLILSTFNPLTTTQEKTDTVLFASYDGVYSGLGLYAVNMTDAVAWGTKLTQLDSWGKSEGIVAMWMYPKELVTLIGSHSWTDGNVTKQVSKVASVYDAVARPSNLEGGYTPRNKKLLTYPFNMLYVTNNSGGAGVYHYELFGDPTDCNFRVVGSLTPEGVTKLYPLNYKGIQHNYEEGLTLGGFPSCAWNQDVYKLWLAQNQNQQSLNMGMAALKIGGGIVGTLASGGLGLAVSGGAVLSGASDIANLLAQRHDKELQPPQAKGTHSASVNISAGFQGYTFSQKCISIQTARILDDYFDLYGYRTNRVKIPNRNVRENWTYTKTIGCHIYGRFCNEDLTKIENIYNNGITFWKNGDSIGNYSLSNNTL